MTRTEEARSLRKQGLKIREIAKQMGITKGTVGQYLYAKKEGLMISRRKSFTERVRLMIRQELKFYGLPSTWEDEITQMFLVYHYTCGSQGKIRRGGKTRIDVQSLIQLMCRRHKVPTPRKLEVLTYQGRGATRMSTGYMHVLAALDGVTAPNPIDYIRSFVEQEKLEESEIDRGQKILEALPRLKLQGKNPRVIAGAIIYELHKPPDPTSGCNRVYTQQYIAQRLEISLVALRNLWHKFIRDSAFKQI